MVSVEDAISHEIKVSPFGDQAKDTKCGNYIGTAGGGVYEPLAGVQNERGAGLWEPAVPGHDGPRILHDPEKVLSDYLAGLRRKLRVLGARRVLLCGG